MAVRRLFNYLPTRSALKHPLMYEMCRGVRPRVVSEHLGKERYPVETVRKYIREKPDMRVLLVSEKPTKRDRASQAVEEARRWLVDECGTTKSGRTLVVKRTPLSRTALWERYRSLHIGGLSFRPFMRACVKERVHFHVGAVDAMSCVVCRSYEAQLAELDGSEAPFDERRRIAILKKQEVHLTNLREQREAYWRHLREVENDTSLGLVTLDFASLVQMDRGHVHDLGCVIATRDEHGKGVHREYVDFLRLPIQGRRRDAVFWVFLELYKRGFLQKRRYKVWSDFGTSDFHSAPAMYAFAQVAAFLEQSQPPVVLESFNFFGARHGWSDADRHFGAISRVITHWFATDATADVTLFLDVNQLMKLMREKISNVHVFDCHSVSLPGVFCDSVPDLTLNHCFETVEGPGKHDEAVRIVAKRHSSDVLGQSILLPGKLVTPKEAIEVARIKRAKRTAAKAKKKAKEPEKRKKKKSKQSREKWK